MKRNKGFTLVELLAVIVILAVIALIAVPIFLRVIEDARRDTFRQNASSVARTAEIAFIQSANQSTLKTKFYIGEQPTLEGGGVDTSYVKLDDIKASTITSAKVYVEEKEVWFYDLTNNQFQIDVTKCSGDIDDNGTKDSCTLEEILTGSGTTDPVVKK